MWSVFKSINLNRSFKMVVFLCFDFQPSLETMSKTGGGHLWHRRQRWHGGGGGRGWSRSGRGRLSLGKCMKKSVMMIDSLSCGKIIPDFFWGMFFFVNGETWRYLIFGIIFSSRLGASGFPSREPSNNLFLFSMGFTSSSSLCSSPTEHCWDVPPWPPTVRPWPPPFRHFSRKTRRTQLSRCDMRGYFQGRWVLTKKDEKLVCVILFSDQVTAYSIVVLM